MADPDATEIANFVGDVIRASKIPAKRRGANIRPTVDKLASLCYQHGVLPEPLAELVELVTRSSYLDQASLNAIVKNLYPAQRLSRDLVLQIVGSLGYGELKPSLGIQAMLLRWLIMVYPIIDGPSILSQSYAVLFNLLDTSAIRSQLCHILALITRRKHVRPFRIQAILNLSRQTGHDPALIGLLRVYKDYYPEIIVGEAVRGKSSSFKHPDKQWEEHLHEVQDVHRRRAEEAAEPTQHPFRVNRERLLRNRRGQGPAIPNVHTSHVAEDAVTLEEIGNVDDLVGNIEKIELPNQLVAILADPLLQILLSLRPAEAYYQRIGNWISSAAEDLVNGDVDETLGGDVLAVLRDYAESTKDVPPVVLNFLAQFFRIWNGREMRNSVMAILVYTPLLDFNSLYQNIFQPLEADVLDNDPESQKQILQLYTKILRHWMILFRSSENLPGSASDTVAKLMEHVNKLILTVLQTSPSVRVHIATLEFYELTSDIVADDLLKKHLRMVLPPPQVVYLLFFSHSVAVASRLCAVLLSYRRGFEYSNATSPARGGGPGISRNTYGDGYVVAFNCFIMDVVNCLWRGRALDASEERSRGCLLPGPVAAQLGPYVRRVGGAGRWLQSAFDLSHSPALCLLAIEHLREREDEETAREEDALATRHGGPVTADSLARNQMAGGIELSYLEYRTGVLESLEAKELGGIAELVRSLVKALKKPTADTTETTVEVPGS